MWSESIERALMKEIQLVEEAIKANDISISTLKVTLDTKKHIRIEAIRLIEVCEDATGI